MATETLTSDMARLPEGRSGRLPPEQSARITQRVTMITVITAIILTALKLLIWERSSSVGMLASLVHSALDIFAALTSFFAVRYAARSPNLTYRFGTGKAESFAAVFQVCLIIIAALHLLETATANLFNQSAHHAHHDHGTSHSGHAGHENLVHADMFTFIGLGILLSLGLAVLCIQSRAIKQTGSLAIRGDRAHYLADLLATILVALGLLTSIFTPFKQADALVAVLMALWLLWTAFRIAKMAWAQLMDKELAQSDRDMISEIALSDKNIIAIHDLRTRASGPHVHIQMRLDLPDDLSLSEAHTRILGLEQKLMHAFPAADILIHPHPVGCADTHGNSRFQIDGDDCAVCHEHNPKPHG